MDTRVRATKYVHYIIKTIFIAESIHIINNIMDEHLNSI